MRVLIAICLVAIAMAAPPDVLHDDDNTASPAPSSPDVMQDDVDDNNTATPATADELHDDDNPTMHDVDGTATPATADELHDDDNPTMPDDDGTATPATADELHDDDNRTMHDVDSTATPATADELHDDDNPTIPDGDGTATPATADELHDDDNTTTLVPPHVLCPEENTSFSDIMPCCRNCTRPCGRDHVESILREFYPEFNYKQKVRILSRLGDDLRAAGLDTLFDVVRGYLLAEHIRHRSESYVKNMGREDECVVEEGEYEWRTFIGLSGVTYVNNENGTHISYYELCAETPPVIVATMLG